MHDWRKNPNFVRLNNTRKSQFSYNGLNNTRLHIDHLISEHGFVAVPGLGTFISRHVPAAIDADGMLSAPSDVISFETYNSQLSDDELCTSLVRALECDTTAASNIMTDDIEHIRREIEIEGSAVIGNSGRLVKGATGIEFEASDNASWLQAIPVAALDAEENVDTEDIAAQMRREAFMRSLSRTASSAAAIAVFAVLAFVFSQLPGRQAGDPKFASIGFEKQTTLPVQPIGGDIQHADPSLVLIFNTPSDASSPVEAEPIAVAQLPKADEGAYCLVVASLANRADAEEFIKYNEGNFSILEKDGRFRVYTMTGENYASLYHAAADAGMFEKHPNAWICKR